MRWLVDVTPLGDGTGTESVQVDADTWQSALLIVRERRGESGVLSGFSIDLLDDGGCRALDPSSRIRYELRSAVERVDASTPGERADGPETHPHGSRGPSPFSSSLPPRPSAQPRAASRAPAGSAGPGEAALAVPSPATAPPARHEAEPAEEPEAAPAAAIPRPAPAARPGDLASVSAAANRPASAPVDPPGPNDVDAEIPSQIIFKREQSRTPAQPLTYREYVYLVPQGTTDGAAERLLRRQLDRVRTSLARTPPGKLVRLAAFDVPFHGKPVARPIATLTWKDWVGTVVVALPHRDQGGGAEGARSPSAAAPVATEGTNGAAAPPDGNLEGGGAAPPAHPGSDPPATSDGRPHDSHQRTAGEDLIADLFEAMHDLHFLRDTVDGGAFCLALCIEKIPCIAGLVHLYDIDRREFLVISTHGAGARQLLLQRTPETDPVLAAATRRRQAIAVTYADEGDPTVIERYDAVGGVRRVLVAPVMQAGRFLGALELIEPIDAQPFTDTEANAVTYIAEQFADFVAARGVVTDPDRIAARAQ